MCIECRRCLQLEVRADACGLSHFNSKQPLMAAATVNAILSVAGQTHAFTEPGRPMNPPVTHHRCQPEPAFQWASACRHQLLTRCQCACPAHSLTTAEHPRLPQTTLPPVVVFWGVFGGVCRGGRRRGKRRWWSAANPSHSNNTHSSRLLLNMLTAIYACCSHHSTQRNPCLAPFARTPRPHVLRTPQCTPLEHMWPSRPCCSWVWQFVLRRARQQRWSLWHRHTVW